MFSIYCKQYPWDLRHYLQLERASFLTVIDSVAFQWDKCKFLEFIL
jgi:hypothetical protein